MDLFQYSHQLARIEEKLDILLCRTETLLEKEKQLVAAIDDLTTQVTANTDAEASAIQLLANISQALKDAIAAGNPAALTALQQKLETSRSALAAAVVANTPAKP